ncbi:sensor histidine kinase [Hymenobacter lapidiphilus]|uniref:Histidine kinase n=1 Tax=Hymenobacter lapidiphilus TaxID=2608003 RepID=A0A7Y7PPR2_9BACT|nr:histidine kinase [Hymenobacter lapidiphilus]NVO31655.1 histidine kinase [Hymenobacter lapidiphilus]
MRRPDPDTAVFFTRRDVGWLALFYLVAALLDRTTVWLLWGGWQTSGTGQPAYLDPSELMASSGLDFLLRFLLSLPISYLVATRLHQLSLGRQLLAYSMLGMVFVVLAGQLSAQLKAWFGWEELFGGRLGIYAYYVTALFYCLQLGLILLLVHVRKYKRAVHEQAQLRDALTRSQLAALKAQLNPHFIHNTFNSINAAIEPANERARELIIDLSDLFRYQHAGAQQELVTVAEEIEFLTKYLGLVQRRFQDRLHVSFAVEQAALTRRMPPMLLQPLVENAVQHGITPTIGACAIHLSVQLGAADRLLFTVADTGAGLPAQGMRPGLGLRNTQLRLEKLCNSALHITSNEPRGVRVEFSL